MAGRNLKVGSANVGKNAFELLGMDSDTLWKWTLAIEVNSLLLREDLAVFVPFFFLFLILLFLPVLGPRFGELDKMRSFGGIHVWFSHPRHQ